MPTPPDYYAILQVDPRAEKEVIDAAYRRLAAKYHPDVSRQAGSAERMIQLNAAYEVLSDPDKRAGYDAGRRARPRVGNTTLDLGKVARSLLIPVAFGLFAFLASRVGPRAALMIMGLLALLGYLLYLELRGRSK